MMQIDLVIFDMAGTTVDDADAVNQCFHAALAAAGLPVSDEAIKEMRGLARPEAIRRLIEQSEKSEELASQVNAIHADFVARMIHFCQTDPAVCEIPGATATFSRLRKRGIKVALNSGFNRNVMNALLERLGWNRSDLINATIASDEVKRARPHPDMIQAVMKKVFVRDARRVAKVGDTPADLLEGANAGCEVIIGVTGGTHTREQLEFFPHSHLIESVAEVPAVLGL
ncbi:MAG TPA: HAD hydrolase-like protein [Blastocatellia bacterium]|nr:HAD hydrolase-like protein [Blastocatellia bacterium]